MKKIELTKEEQEYLTSFLVTKGVILTQYIAMFRSNHKELFDKYVAEKRMADTLISKLLKSNQT